jgi:hypothetical protein
VFPDLIARWRPYPSIIDGIERPPFVLDRGLWQGILHLIILSPKPHLRHYGVQIRCDAYFGIEEMIYSVADHGGGTLRYDGGVYIKETDSSALLTTYRVTNPVDRGPRHFSFVGGDYCYEALGLSEPSIRQFASEKEAYEWRTDEEV